MPRPVFDPIAAGGADRPIGNGCPVYSNDPAWALRADGAGQKRFAGI
jgi:hypothetical protein